MAAPAILRIVHDRDGTWDVVKNPDTYPRTLCESRSEAGAQRYVDDWRAYERGERERPVGFTPLYD